MTVRMPAVTPEQGGAYGVFLGFQLDDAEMQSRLPAAAALSRSGRHARRRLTLAPGASSVRACQLSPAGEIRAVRLPGGAAPKEQPPRKLSGRQDRGGMALWRAGAPARVGTLHRRGKSRPAASLGRVNLSGPGQRGLNRRTPGRPADSLRRPGRERPVTPPAPSEPAPHAAARAARELGGRMVDFAGWSLPVQYPAGIMAEHRHCRSAAALFDVSHMGQVLVHGAARGRGLRAPGAGRHRGARRRPPALHRC